jgi:hypothetical protein
MSKSIIINNESSDTICRNNFSLVSTRILLHNYVHTNYKALTPEILCNVDQKFLNEECKCEACKMFVYIGNYVNIEACTNICLLSTACWLLASLSFQCWKMERNIPPKHRLSYSGPYGVTSQKTQTSGIEPATISFAAQNVSSMCSGLCKCIRFCLS